MYNYCTPHIIKENSENFLIHRCNYILLSQVYCVWQVVKTTTIICNKTVYKIIMNNNKDVKVCKKNVTQCTFNVTLRRVRTAIVAVESNEYYTIWVCVCSLRYPACNAHALYCHLWYVRFYNIFPRYLIKGTIFEEKKLLNTKCVSIFLLFLVKHFSSWEELNEKWSEMYIDWSACKIPAFPVKSE
jgi:hypothetical protein